MPDRAEEVCRWESLQLGFGIVAVVDDRWCRMAIAVEYGAFEGGNGSRALPRRAR